MTTTTLRNRLVKRLQLEDDKTVLATIAILLRDDSKEDALRRRMTEMAIRSEEAIQKGEVMTVAEARKRSKRVLQEIAASRPKARRA